MNRSKPQHRARRHAAYLAIVFLAACGGGGGGGSGGGTTAPPPPPAPVTFETMLTDITINDMATGDPVSVNGLPLGSAEISVSP